MRTYYHIEPAAFKVGYYARLLFRRYKAVKQSHRHGHIPETPHRGIIVLHCKYCGRHQKRALLALAYAFKRRAQGNLRFAEAHIAAKQAVHRHLPLHIVLYFVNTAQLILCFVIFKAALKIALQVGIGAECIALYRHSFGIKRG